MQRAVFLDRDGTMGGDGWYCHPEEFTLFLESGPAIKRLNDSGFKVVVITTQTHVGKGEITLDQVHTSFVRLQEELKAHGAHLDGWYVCPHVSRDKCECRKPNPHLLLQAARDFDVDLASSYMIGDSGVADVGAGAAAGCRTILVLTGLGQGSLTTYRHEWQNIEPDFVADNILRAAEYVVAREVGRWLPNVRCRQ